MLLFATVLLVATTLMQLCGAAITNLHQPGTCAMYQNCGKKSFFGAELPCPYNTDAVTPDTVTRNNLVEICGTSWADSDVCCDSKQLDNLRTNLKKAETLISSCPACQYNFVQFFCTFTCSPNQSQFVNITNVGKSTSGNDIVTELSYFVDDGVASEFYDSCKEVKFSATNGYVMDLIGGGAEDYEGFLKFLGDEKPLLGGSPFQINFPWQETPNEIKRAEFDTKLCSDPDERYKCACVDCTDACPTLPPASTERKCHIGALPCFSISVILVYTASLVVFILAYKSVLTFNRGPFYKPERLRLLNDRGGASEDEEEGDIVATAELVERPSFRTYSLNTFLQSKLTTIGLFCAQFPGLVIGLSLFFVAILSLGWFHFSIETNPVRLWVSPGSSTYQEKLFYDENFGPFYRAEQAFLVNDDGPLLNYETLKWWFEVESNVSAIVSPIYETTFDDVCLKPTDEACVIQSVTQYFGGDINNVDKNLWRDQLSTCTSNPVNCLPPFQQPLKPSMILGGVDEDSDYSDARAIIVSWVVNNAEENSVYISHVMEWEALLESYMLDVQQQARDRGLRLSFSTEISLEKELNKSTNTDAKIVVSSYACMFIYVSWALGKISWKSGKQILVQSKVTLGLVGLLIVLFSVSASIGFFSILGVKVTLIIAEVIPFLVLAVGVDNIFLLSHELELVNEKYQAEPVEHRIARALGRMGPSILLSASCETIAFALGAIVAMPAVRNFAIYAAGAVFLDALLQVTMFISVLTLDQKRTEDNKVDCLPFLQISKSLQQQQQQQRNIAEDGWLTRFIKFRYAPAILKKEKKAVIFSLFIGIFALALALVPKIKIGLDQRIAIPNDSYLIDYFNDFYEYFDSGPPVYFVTRERNFTERAEQKTICGRFSTCEDFSLLNILEQERKRPEVSFIAEPAASWIDDFFHWLNPNLDECCRFKKGSTDQMCAPNARDWQCDVCYANKDPAWNITLNGLPQGQEFMKFFSFWIDSPSDPCPLGGKAPYSNAVVPDYERTTIKASSFRTFHTPLRSTEDFIDAYSAAKRIASDVSESSGAEVFAYSPFYIFFDQYLTIFRLTILLISLALASTLTLSSIFLGSFRTGLVVTATVGMIVVDIMGVMTIWGIGLNAVSLVNLVICVGIGVEFCSHISRAFMVPNKDVLDLGRSRMRGKNERVWAALASVGGSVLSGITFTKLIGVSVLAFTRSKIFEIYYFRMWLTLVIVAAAHGLIFLPVALSYFGGGPFNLVDEEELYSEDAARRYRLLFEDLESADEDEAEEEQEEQEEQEEEQEEEQQMSL
ncbi:sterol-sensing domain of SREBP cleavage-activation-domain-containing protein [Lipomyces japonicus]|uniref:sterol-sensing domain of SREBP cleavage-activation-domain-containing protein n=1 Tax=Lipomyces japonicus TaxID=56871 RepID=UPI0034CE8815